MCGALGHCNDHANSKQHRKPLFHKLPYRSCNFYVDFHVADTFIFNACAFIREYLSWLHCMACRRWSPFFHITGICFLLAYVLVLFDSTLCETVTYAQAVWLPSNKYMWVISVSLLVALVWLKARGRTYVPVVLPLGTLLYE